MDNTLKYSLLLLGLVIVFAVIYVFIKEQLSKRKMLTGEDKKMLQKFLSETIPNSEEYTSVFAYFNNWTKEGRTTTTYYYYFTISFKDGEIIIVPCNYENNTLVAIDSFMKITPNDIGSVVHETSSDFVSTEFLDEEKKRLLAYIVAKKTSNSDAKECPLAIDQEEETEKYIDFIKDFK